MPPRDPDELELEALRSTDPQPTDTADMSRTRRLGAAARSLGDQDLTLDEPPPDLWDRIAGRVGPEADVTPAAPSGEVDVHPLALHRPASASGAALPGRVRHHPRRTGWLVGAAAAAILAVVGVLAVVTRGDDGTSTLATADLEVLTTALPGTESATASVVTSDGHEALDVTLDVPDAPGFYEVWLIDRNVDGMVSLGPVRADGRYEIPPGVDIGAFPIVDVSIEPADGVPTHSGRSALRGTLS